MTSQAGHTPPPISRKRFEEQLFAAAGLAGVKALRHFGGWPSARPILAATLRRHQIAELDALWDRLPAAQRAAYLADQVLSVPASVPFREGHAPTDLRSSEQLHQPAVDTPARNLHAQNIPEFLALLQQLQKNSGLSVNALARRAEVPKSTLYRWLSGAAKTGMPRDVNQLRSVLRHCGLKPGDVDWIARLWAELRSTPAGADTEGTSPAGSRPLLVDLRYVGLDGRRHLVDFSEPAESQTVRLVRVAEDAHDEPPVTFRQVANPDQPPPFESTSLRPSTPIRLFRASMSMAIFLTVLLAVSTAGTILREVAPTVTPSSEHLDPTLGVFTALGAIAASLSAWFAVQVRRRRQVRHRRGGEGGVGIPATV